MEIGEPVAVARDDLAVDEAVTGREGLNRRNDDRRFRGDDARDGKRGRYSYNGYVDDRRYTPRN